jgi:putative tricarboxylic transport membrane protein
MHRSPKDILAGLIFAGFGLAFAVGASTYRIGTPERMGPGFYPLLVGSLLVVLAVVIIVRPVEEPDAEPLTPPPWPALALILSALVVFGLAVRGLGLAPSIFIASSLAALASYRTSLPMALLYGLVLTLVSLLIFVVALRLNLPLWGPWIPRL